MRLKELRTRLGMTQRQVADGMHTTQQTVARWETGKTTLNVDQIRDLCLLLHCKAEELLGWSVPPEDWRRSPFAISDAGVPYGTLRIALAGGKRDFPIDEHCAEVVSHQLEQLHPVFVGDDGRPWLYAHTLDNKIIMINTTFLRSVELVSEAVEEMSDFQHPEVYRALGIWPSESLSDAVRASCQAVIDEVGEEEATRMATDIRVTYGDSTADWHLLDQKTAMELSGFAGASMNVASGRFFQAAREGADRALFINLDCVAMFEIPEDMFHRLTAPDEQ